MTDENDITHRNWGEFHPAPRRLVCLEFSETGGDALVDPSTVTTISDHRGMTCVSTTGSDVIVMGSPREVAARLGLLVEAPDGE